VATVGVPEFWHRSPGFSTLVLLILEQQVSLESGAAMFRRLLGELGPVTAPSLLNTGEAGLRALGVTRQKTGYLLGLSTEVIEGDLDLEGLADMSVQDARDRLLRLHGIGRWTADAYLLSALRHPDVFPVGDRALQVGAAETLGLKTPPDEGALEILAEPWRPIRAVAARLIWHDYLTRRGRTEPELPQHITRAQA
jgi:DNA-3-methyladenine glycosylase II